MEPKYKIEVNKGRCVGSTMCLQHASHIFGLDKNKQSQVMDPDTTDAEQLLAAAESCPTGSISVWDVATGKKLFPETPTFDDDADA